MGTLEFILSIVGIVATGGWFVTYRAYKKKNEGEAAQAEAGGWKAQQEVYQSTIEHLKNYCEYLQKEIERLLKENDHLCGENSMLREKIFELEKQMADLRRDIARQGRRIESLNNKSKRVKEN